MLVMNDEIPSPECFCGSTVSPLLMPDAKAHMAGRLERA